MKLIKSKQKKRQQPENLRSFETKNKALLEQIFQTNDSIKKFAVHLSQYCDIVQDGEKVDVSTQLSQIVDHMDRMNFVFKHIETLEK